MAVLIDASVLIEYERGRLDLDRRIRGREAEDCFLSVVTASELLHGIHRASTPALQTRRSAFVEAVLERFAILPIDLVSARAHAQLWAQLASAGCLIGPHDLWLAATCIAHDLTMITANLREFERVPGLRVESWLDAE
jgi:tRNA(fMet)-specific endonuclease VapC